ncbi:hypothetical protein AAHC03_09588 [Spirometra sp. Aus1]
MLALPSAKADLGHICGNNLRSWPTRFAKVGASPRTDVDPLGSRYSAEAGYDEELRVLVARLNRVLPAADHLTDRRISSRDAGRAWGSAM